jgi:hypothetical protein
MEVSETEHAQAERDLREMLKMLDFTAYAARHADEVLSNLYGRPMEEL